MSNEIHKWLKLNFYEKNADWIIDTEDLKAQKDGIDCIAKINNQVYLIDEKITLHSDLPTFCVELESSKGRKGWGVRETQNDTYLIGWLDVSKNEAELILISKEKIKNWIENLPEGSTIKTTNTEEQSRIILIKREQWRKEAIKTYIIKGGNKI